MTGEGGAGDGKAAHVGCGVAVGDAQLEEAGRAEIMDQRAARRIDIVGVDIAEVGFAP